MQSEYHKLLENTGGAVSQEQTEAEWNKQFIEYLEKRDAKNAGTASSSDRRSRAHDRAPRCALFHDPGCGKTPIAAAWVKCAGSSRL